MSHTAVVKVNFADRAILKQVCQRLGLKFTEGKHSVQLFSGSVQAEFSVKLPGWNYPVAICGETAKYDNYNGSWGKIRELETLQDQYSRDVTMKQAQLAGYQVQEEVDETGEITLILYDYSE